MTVPLKAQAAAVERIVMNVRGHIRILRELVHKRKRPQHDLDAEEMLLPHLEAAANTLRRLCD